ncbi:MAG TPA: cell division protein ZapA [Chitinophagaceae bacterium]|nr:cell division protein ZapA [Chitinophagaceae bacterium]
MAELIPVNIVIGDRTYRIRILPRDEEVVRRTVKTINDKILEFRTQFAGKDMQDYISMVLVWFATEQNGALQAGVDPDQLAEKLAGLERLLDSHLPQA